MGAPQATDKISPLSPTKSRRTTQNVHCARNREGTSRHPCRRRRWQHRSSRRRALAHTFPWHPHISEHEQGTPIRKRREHAVRRRNDSAARALEWGRIECGKSRLIPSPQTADRWIESVHIARDDVVQMPPHVKSQLQSPYQTLKIFSLPCLLLSHLQRARLPTPRQHHGRNGDS